MDLSTVYTKNGAVRGKYAKGIYAWLGIPYAQPPVGGLRFQPARPAADWEGVRDATLFSPVCWQQRKNASMSEDCLTLNIWSPMPDDKKRPVLFFIHGGSFVCGAGSDDDINGARLSAFGDVVVVTINYRLGVLGFLDFSFLGEEFYPNCGLTDIIEALRWTHENIEAFGGDPHNITVFGQSAGAVAASALPIVPSARPLLSKVIMMSGDPTLPHTREQYREISRRFLEYMNISDPGQLLAMPAEQLTARQMEFTRWCRLGAGTFMLEIDGELIQEYPIPAAAKGAARDIPILIGTTREEMSFLFIKSLAGQLDVKGIFDALVHSESDETRNTIREAYRRYGRKGRMLMTSDIVFRIGSAWYAEAYSAHSDTWMYCFDYETPAMQISKLHAFHSCDIPFVFGNHNAGQGRWMFLLSFFKTRTKKVSDEMRGDFITFAKTGKLPWEKCRGAYTPGKCYDCPTVIGHMIDPDIKEAYNRTEYRRRSFAGESNTLLK
jgi:para-nitrobenzyl esterase